MTTAYHRDFGDYRVLRSLGRSVRTTTFEALQRESREGFALKVWDQPLPIDKRRLFDRLLVAASSVRACEHELLVPNEVPLFEEGFIVVPKSFVEGRSLAAEVRLAEQLSPEKVLAAARDVAVIIDLLHEGGVCHGHITPENIIVASDSRWHLTDAGLFVLPDELAPTALLHRKEYPFFARETLLARKLTPASDRYSFAATLFFALSGVSPFSVNSSSDEDALAACVSGARMSLGAVAAHLPLPLDAVFERALHGRPERRIARATEIVDRCLDATIKWRASKPKSAEEANEQISASAERAAWGWGAVLSGASIGLVMIAALSLFWRYQGGGPAMPTDSARSVVRYTLGDEAKSAELVASEQVVVDIQASARGTSGEELRRLVQLLGEARRRSLSLSLPLTRELANHRASSVRLAALQLFADTHLVGKPVADTAWDLLTLFLLDPLPVVRERAALEIARQYRGKPRLDWELIRRIENEPSIRALLSERARPK